MGETKRTDDEIKYLIGSLDSVARAYDSTEYGLPWADEPLTEMIAEIREWEVASSLPASPATPNEELVVDLARELYDRFVMGGWEPEDAYPQIRALLAESRSTQDKRIRELEEWKKSALVQLGKAEKLKAALPTKYLGWDVYDAAFDYIDKFKVLAEARAGDQGEGIELQWFDRANSNRAMVGGVPTFSLAGRFCAGDSIADLADDYEIPPAAVEVGLRHELRIREGLDEETKVPAPEESAKEK